MCYLSPCLHEFPSVFCAAKTQRIICGVATIGPGDSAPQCLSDLLQPYTPARQLRSASDTRTFVTPRVNTKTFGERSFSYAGPSVWNDLPQTLRHSDSTSSFKAAPVSMIISKPFFTALPIPSFDAVCVCVVSVTVKYPVLPPCVVDGRSRNPLYYYYYY